MSVLEQDVSDQVHDVPVAGHIGDVHLVLNFDYEVPSEPGSDGAGFDGGKYLCGMKMIANNFIDEFIPVFQSYYSYISQDREQVSLSYESHAAKGNHL